VSAPTSTDWSGPVTHARAPASDSPVTCQTWGASPQPVTPSVSVTRTTTLSVVVVRRRAVTNGVCSGLVTSTQETFSILLILGPTPRSSARQWR
jgi:hypothetical protein